jgi:hypothetical protein
MKKKISKEVSNLGPLGCKGVFNHALIFPLKII